jgi:nicotinamidase-related amidase
VVNESSASIEEGRGEHFSERRVRDLARRAYRSQASFDIVPDDSALLVIDMQDEFVRPGWTPYWVPGATRLVDGIKELIALARRRSIPVIFTAFATTHQGADRPHSGAVMANRYPDVPHDPDWFRTGTIWHELEPRSSEIVVYKPSYGAFYDTPLQTILRNLDRNTIIICGTLTNFCCGATARQGYERGFNVVVVGDLTATDDEQLHEAELRTLQKGFARVVSLQDLIETTSATHAT